MIHIPGKNAKERAKNSKIVNCLVVSFITLYFIYQCMVCKGSFKDTTLQ